MVAACTVRQVPKTLPSQNRAHALHAAGSVRRRRPTPHHTNPPHDRVATRRPWIRQVARSLSAQTRSRLTGRACPSAWPRSPPPS
eukprot:7224721-Prymnesium_polylepis.1